MSIIEPIIISPDSSHWAKWIDATWSPNLDRRQRAGALHRCLIEQGRIPLLSWHHMVELLGGQDDSAAQARVAFLQKLPLLAWLRLPQEEGGIGSIAQVLAAEAIAASEGLDDLISIRDRARTLLLRIGSGVQAIGEEPWVWEVLRQELRGHKRNTGMVAAFSPMRQFNKNMTIGELSKLDTNSRSQMRAQLNTMYLGLLEQTTQRLDGDAVEAKAMTENFMTQVDASMPPSGTKVRDFLVSILTNQGLDENEIRDEDVLADLMLLGLFRSRLRIIASETGRSFNALKKLSMGALPSHVIQEALKTHGQPRMLRPGSDVHDGHLAVLAAYCTVLYVDKRTFEDFRRVTQKEPRLKRLIGEVAKAADFDALLAPIGC